MAQLYKQLNPAISQYKDRRFCGSQQEFDECLHTSTTVYVGNLSFFTTEDQIFEVGPRSATCWRRTVGTNQAERQKKPEPRRALCCQACAPSVTFWGLAAEGRSQFAAHRLQARPSTCTRGRCSARLET